MSNKDTTAILQRLQRTIESRLGPGRGFALLTFPLGHAVNPLIHYTGNADKRGTVGLMEHWCRCQHEGEFSAEDEAAKAVNWITDRPTIEGLYLLKADGAADPDFVKLVLCDGDLRINHWAGDQWEDGFDFVRDLDTARHLWFGPFAEPWKSPDAIARGEVILSPATIAEHHMPHFEAMFQEYLVEFNGRCKDPEPTVDTIPEMVRQMIHDALAHGYAQGIAQQLNRPAY